MQTILIHHYVGEAPAEMLATVSEYDMEDTGPDDWGAPGYAHCCTMEVEVPDCWPVGDGFTKV